MAKKKIREEDQKLIDYYMDEYGFDLEKDMQDRLISLKEYIELMETYMIFEGHSLQSYEEAKKVIEELMKHLKNRRATKVYNLERLEEYCTSKSNV